jgi:tetratricopeptide (TPR) repeat protein
MRFVGSVVRIVLLTVMLLAPIGALAQQSVADLNETIRLDPKDAIAHHNRGLAYKNKGDYDRAIADYNEAIRLDPEYALAYNNRGVAYLLKGDHDRAIADYNEAIRLDPGCAKAY